MEKTKLGPQLSQTRDFAEGDVHDVSEPQLRRNRSFITVLGMALTITAIPYGIGGPFMAAIYGGGQLCIFVGLLVILVLQGCVAISLGELASRFPTSSGVYYWSFRLTHQKPYQHAVSYLTGWVWLIGNWTITLSVNFGFATMITATISIYQPQWVAKADETLFIFFGICILVFIICSLADRVLPLVDALAAVWNLVTIIAILLAVSIAAKTPRHTVSQALGHYDGSLSGWGDGFSFFIGLLPPAYAFASIGMVVSMAEECVDPETEVARGITMCIPLGGIAALLFVLPICFTLPVLQDILTAPYGQALPYIITIVTGSKPLALALMIMILVITLCCSLSVTTTASRCTWALSRDGLLPFSNIWSRTTFDQPLYALVLVTVLQMLLGCINLGSTSAFTAFVSVGVIALAVSYLIPISISLASGRKEVSKARWTFGKVPGLVANLVAVLWILFELVLFSMPTVVPVTAASMNYAAVVFIGFLSICMIWYLVWGRKTHSESVI
ncbi:unnamed protein product [Clonostachys chloroleuca]|uniref:Amino acid transporter n=1 Tax=Clonostachys chloroleuca TaxID=1926264 RepID=A0AA35M1T6_9HYPO|nr:unnamed protein product [Clonostachys chloroleuca]